MAENGFEVIDKRKVRSSEGTAPGAESAAEQPAQGEQSPVDAPAAGSETAGAAVGASETTEAAGGREEPRAQQQAGAEQPAEDEAGAYGIPPQMLAPDLPVLIASMVEMLAAQAWWLMGLTTNPRTGRVEKEMAKAKLAIDCVQFLVDKVAPMLEEPVRRELRHRVADLQVNFVQQGQNP